MVDRSDMKPNRSMRTLLPGRELPVYGKKARPAAAAGLAKDRSSFGSILQRVAAASRARAEYAALPGLRC
jgi:hypothetical protein